MKKMDFISIAKRVVKVECDALHRLERQIDINVANAIETILICKGRIVITGMGKSGLIARKIVSTMNSTGTPAIFLHPSEAMHGDVGVVRRGDVVMVISKNGENDEFRMLIPVFKKLGVPIIAMVGAKNSFLAVEATIVLDVSVKAEACPLDLAPTASTTAALAMGDAISVALLEAKGFTQNDFAERHPSGALGRQLTMRVDDLMVQDKALPRVQKNLGLREAIVEMTSKRQGATCVVDKSNNLVGILTDGDLRRLLYRTSDITNLVVGNIMTHNPKTVSPGTLAIEALQIMEKYTITQIVVMDDKKKPLGMVHLHDIVKAGIGIKK